MKNKKHRQRELLDSKGDDFDKKWAKFIEEERLDRLRKLWRSNRKDLLSKVETWSLFQEAKLQREEKKAAYEPRKGSIYASTFYTEVRELVADGARHSYGL
jgi:hypothetical protein